MIWLILGLFTFIIHKLIIFPAFSNLEYIQAKKNGERVINGVDRELHFLDNLCKDWAYWDDTYTFVTSNDPEYLSSNINKKTYGSNELNLIYIVKKDGHVLWGKCYDLIKDEYIFVEEIPTDKFPVTHPMYISVDENNPLTAQGISGIMRTRLGFMLFSSQPILTTENKGPSQGMLIMGKLISPSWVARFSKQVNLKLEFLDLTKRQVNNDQKLEENFKKLNQKKSFYIDEVADSFLNIYSPLFDVNSNKIIMVKIAVKGEIIDRGKKTLTFALNSSALAAIAILCLMFLLISKSIVTPLSTLSEHIHKISKTGDLSSRLSFENRDDEIGSLGRQYNNMLDQLEKKTEQLNRLATTDPLTGLHNRRHAFEFLERGAALADRYQQNLAILLIDLDYFKKVNDTYGHHTGDEVLVRVGHVLKTALRSTDIVARIGGEEFLIILPHQNVDAAMLIGEKLRASIERLEWAHKDLKVTISGGICADKSLSPLEMLARADQLLYAAKDQGRNRLVSS